ncbi:DUF86 domain-containing protein [Infirmifilum lucidum]|uniref:DUF86 domain-containing protein n=2 Tax=Infirmifilum lucidum TaxID=2776706 RepID=A0A7L9FJB1_9CREN|nr:DUF86 domain-containing protein [Infirmifilum lucidum]
MVGGGAVDRGEVVRRLSELFSELRDVEVAVLFGSLARGSPNPRDIDIAVRFSAEKSLLDLSELAVRIAEKLGVGVEAIDIVDLGGAKPLLLFKVLKEGVVVKGSEDALMKLLEKALLGTDQLMETRLWGTLDPEPKVDEVIISSRVEEIRRNRDFLRSEILTKKVEELTYKDVLALERAVHRIIEAILDICRHLIAVHSLGLVESYGEYPLRLARANIMPRDLAEDVSRLAALRNILVHRYLEIDLRELYEAAERIVGHITPKFLEWIKDLSKDNTSYNKAEGQTHG